MEGNRKKEDGPNGSPSSKHGLVDRSKEKHNITPFSGGMSTLHVLDKLDYPYVSSLNVLIVSLVNAL
jgi:hypothetical protein